MKATGLVALLAVAAPVQAADGSDVFVTVTNLRSADGKVRACLVTEHRKYYTCETPGVRRVAVPATGKVVLAFRGVQPGRYAISLIHDENDNDKADTTLGIPKEGFGFSRNAKVRTGPPRFDKAAFDVGTAPVRQTVVMQYLF